MVLRASEAQSAHIHSSLPAPKPAPSSQLGAVTTAFWVQDCQRQEELTQAAAIPVALLTALCSHALVHNSIASLAG